MAQNPYANMHSAQFRQNSLPSQIYSSYAPSHMHSEHGNAVDSLTESFENVNLQNNSYSVQDNAVSGYVPNGGQSLDTKSGSKMNGNLLYHLNEGSYTQAGPIPTQAAFRQFPQVFNWPTHSASPYQPAPFQSYAPTGSTHGPNTPRGSQWLSSQPLSALPDMMEPRRSSWSSRDDASPQTPTFGPGQAYPYVPGQSPAAYSTPSPMSASNASYPHIWKSPNGEPVVVDFWALVNREPAIPEPVPAIRSGPDGGRGTLDKILDNRDGTTNVYVRGLQPDTSDDMLTAYGARFGTVVSCKSIIDASTNHCKGFGFIKYHNYVDAENCIRGFYHRGYEAKFARKSHNSRLKDLARPDNTNLYVSNLPRLINEEGLKKLFQTVYPEDSFPHHQAGSCKILKDSCGVGRGVGFARFETPIICEEIIEAFSNRSFGEGKDATALQIRYADTEEQKQLKAFTAVKRQFKADEYNEAVYGVPFNTYSPGNAPYQSPLQSRTQGINGSWINLSPASSVSPASLSNHQYSVLRSRQASNSVGRGLGTAPFDESSGAIDHHMNRVKIEQPDTAAPPKVVDAEKVKAESTDEASSSQSEEATLVENTKPSSKSSTKELVVSPTKSML